VTGAGSPPRNRQAISPARAVLFGSRTTPGPWGGSPGPRGIPPSRSRNRGSRHSSRTESRPRTPHSSSPCPPTAREFLHLTAPPRLTTPAESLTLSRPLVTPADPRRFVSGHGFSRAARHNQDGALAPAPCLIAGHLAPVTNQPCHFDVAHALVPTPGSPCAGRCRAESRHATHECAAAASVAGNCNGYSAPPQWIDCMAFERNTSIVNLASRSHCNPESPGTGPNNRRTEPALI
jgi:hypothetical protein